MISDANRLPAERSTTNAKIIAAQAVTDPRSNVERPKICDRIRLSTYVEYFDNAQGETRVYLCLVMLPRQGFLS